MATKARQQSTLEKLIDRDKKAKEEQEEVDLQLLATLAELGGSKLAESDIVFQGKKIVLPENLSTESAIEVLQGKMRDEKQEVDFHGDFNYRPYDGAAALMRVFERIGGMWTQKPIDMGFFGIDPPHLISVPVSPTRSVQVPWGQIQVPFLPGVSFFTQVQHNPDLGPLFRITVHGPKMYKHQVQGVFKMIEEELKNHSIYRGQAIDGAEWPQYLPLHGVDERKVTYSDEVLAQLNANVWTTIEYTDVLRKLNMPIKRAVLLEGPYGTGKTLAAYLTGKRSVASGWTFIYVRPDQDLLLCMQTARLYSPACVFFEDLDAIQPKNGDRDSTSMILDAFDGIAAKGVDVLVLLTTNHAELIHKGMVRPGRLDAVIHIGALDQEGIERLIRSHIADEVLDKSLDFAAIYQAMEGYVPAFAVEAIHRTNRYAISRTGKPPETLTTEDFVNAAAGLRDQLKLMLDDKDEKKITIEELLGGQIKGTVKEVVDALPYYCSDCQEVHRVDVHEPGRPDKPKNKMARR